MNNFAEILLSASEKFQGKQFIVHSNGEKDYDSFCEEVARLSSALVDRQVGRDTRVILLGQNSPEWLVSFFAIAWVGAAAVPINPGLTASEVQAIVRDCNPAAAIVDASLRHLVEDLPSNVPRLVMGGEGDLSWHRIVETATASPSPAVVYDDDPVVIFYTSGTTGRPKGVMLTHSGMIFDVTMFAMHLQISPSDRSLVVGSMAFMLHLILNAASSIYGGSTLYLLERFRPELALRTVEAQRITLFFAVPTVYIMMLNWREQNAASVDIGSIRWAISSGSSFPGPLYQRALSELNLQVYDLWGLSECAPVTSYYPGIDKGGRPDSCGRPLPGCAVRIVDDEFNDLPQSEIGEVLLKSPAMMSGYFNNPTATTETIIDGWVRSGDLGMLDQDGYLFIVGRKKDMLIRGGSNIYPVEIEEVLYLHSAVSECAIIGVPDATFGELVKACVVLKPGASLTCEELREFGRQHLAEYKVPGLIEFLSELPKGPTGKILRRTLREAHAGDSAGELSRQVSTAAQG